MLLDAVVADANVLLSAAVGKAGRKIFTKSAIRVHITEFNAAEVEEYLPWMAEKYHLPIDLVRLQWKLLPLIPHANREYEHLLKKAVSDLSHRDPEGAHALALARALRLPLWSNDRHLDKLDIPTFPTANLLRILNIS